MKNLGMHVITTENELLAQRVAQYVDDETNLQPVVDHEDGQYVVRAHSRGSHIDKATVARLACIALGIEWMRQHEYDLVAPLSKYPNYYQYLNNTTAVRS